MMSKYLRMPPTRERRVNRMRMDLISDMLGALKLAYPCLAKNLITEAQRASILATIRRAEQEVTYDRTG